MYGLPLQLDLQGRDCLVVGAGEVALRKINALLDAGARITLVAPDGHPDLKKLVQDCAADDRRVAWHRRCYQPDDVVGRWLVVSATGDTEVSRQVYADCEAARIWVNTVDQPAFCSVLFPARVDRGAVQIAIGTSGRSPTLSRILRAWLEARLPARLGQLAQFAGERRQQVRAQLPDAQARQQFWQKVLDGPPAESVLAGDEAGAARQFDAHLLQASQAAPAPGLVALVGAGPGDAELITLRGLRLLQQADVVLYDNLVGKDLLNYARRDAQRVYVGKKRAFAFKSARQAAINALMAEHALAGRRVVRLKGGDPFIFGRGGEEVETLAAQGIDWVVVPGITAALGAASYAGVPLTHRDAAQSVRFVTGHRSGDRINLDWHDLASPGQTLVIYMGLLGLAEIARELVAHGLNPATPALLIEAATLPEQREVEATIRDLPEAVASAGVSGPTVVVVGEVVRFRTRRS